MARQFVNEGARVAKTGKSPPTLAQQGTTRQRRARRPSDASDVAGQKAVAKAQPPIFISLNTSYICQFVSQNQIPSAAQRDLYYHAWNMCGRPLIVETAGLKTWFPADAECGLDYSASP
jgi:hypothetical protein